MFSEGHQVHGSFRVFDFTGHPRLGLQAKPEAIDRAKKFISDGLASGLFSAKIDRVFVGLDEYATAHRYIGTNDQIGKIAVALSNYLYGAIKKPPSEA
jgi:NADPH:quinone reductase-like Zn-dependent oxidoreductase